MARFDLGLSDEEFWALTPRRMDALVQRWERAREHSDMMLAQIAQTGANFSFCAPKKPFTIDQFMPQVERRSAEEIEAQQQDAFTATFVNYLMTAKAMQERGSARVLVVKGQSVEEALEKQWASPLPV